MILLMATIASSLNLIFFNRSLFDVPWEEVFKIFSREDLELCETFGIQDRRKKRASCSLKQILDSEDG